MQELLGTGVYFCKLEVSFPIQQTFQVDMQNSIKLRQLAPDNVLFVSESGIRTAEDIRKLYDNQVDAVLIGETLMRSADKKAALETLNDMYPEFWTHIYKLGGHYGCFSVFYRRHPFCFCLDSFAIIVINIFINSNCKFFK